ncbi:DUF2252 domain-containing protein [Conexibacter sp. CPCC 206217]|uniref:DUF2252 domain-containing protein n=1 Tax=Conexibacter sp. CPCC 206217 TaxID=3064574 RepID=UPI0027216C48|nr:DUF2252 domain-containing protein [Conexibacter sp. CPCC 206217]MDO8214203.1 DUF2252 domain-containing protein [Conexibacter sp. CPCC 206217]
MSAPTRRERLTARESAERGKAARAVVPRSSHGEWAPAPDRADPVAQLSAQAADRLQELVPIRHGRMLASPFAFYRGAATVMAADLAATPDSGFTVQACGDAHISNFGGFAAPDRRQVFDINDFDETLPGPWEWDVKRMAASAEIAGRERGLSADARTDVVEAAVREYRVAMREFAAEGNLAVWYARMDLDQLRARYGTDIAGKDVATLRRAAVKARRKDSARALTKLTHVVDGRLRFLSEPPLLVPIEELVSAQEAVHTAEWMNGLIASYSQSLRPDHAHLLAGYRYVHLARKVVGVGSVGTRAWVTLLEGSDGADPLVLQAKEADASVLEPHVGASEYEERGRRVVEGQRLMQAASDIFLGWDRATGLDGATRDFYVRQLWDWKLSGDVERMTATAFPAYVRVCGWSLARAHARTGDRVAIASYLGSGAQFDRAITRFAAAYADQNERDHAALAEAAAAGEIEAREGV